MRCCPGGREIVAGRTSQRAADAVTAPIINPAWRRPGRFRQPFAKIGPVLKHPLVIAVLVGAFSALLIPQITQQWQDRQKEQDLKQSLLEQISTSSTTAVRQGVSLAMGQTRAAGGEDGETSDKTYAVLRNSWLVRRASARSRVIVYFPGLYDCWYSYERAVADFLSLSPGGGTGKSAATRVKWLEQYVNDDFATAYGDGSTLDGCAPLGDLPSVVRTRLDQLKGPKVIKWPALRFKSENKAFRDSYAALAEALLIGMERIVYTVEKTPADGFNHGIGHWFH